MKIGIDIRSLMEGKRSGVQEYLLNLMRALFVIDRENEYKLFCNAYKKTSLDIEEFLKFSNVKLYKFNYPNKVLNSSFMIFGKPKIDKMMGGLDIFFAPNILFSAISKNCKFVTTIHDLSFDYFKRFYSMKRRFWHNIVRPRKKIESSDAVICVSQITADDLVNKYKIGKDKVNVVYSGVEARSKKQEVGVREKYNLPERFILFLGAMEPRKNIVGLIEAFDLLKFKIQNSKLNQNSKFKIQNLKLVIAGSGGWLEKRVRRVYEQSEFKDDIMFLGYVDVEDKVGLYGMANLFVFPSFYEGFGFPPLEAMKCGTPVVCANTGSLPEVCGDGAVLVDPYNIEELSEAMGEVLGDGGLRESLVEKGLRRVERFGWERCARETLGVFEKCRIKNAE